MEQVCVRWQNIIDHGDFGVVVGALPLSIGHGETNDVVLSAPSVGACYQDVRLTSIGESMVLVDLCSAIFGNQDREGASDLTISDQRPFYLGLYRFTVNSS